MKRFFAAFLILITIYTPVLSFGDFDKAIEDSQEQKQNSPEEKKSKKSSTSPSSSSSLQDDAETSLVEFFLEIFAYLWLFNAEARYCPYPYSSPNTKYLVYNDFIPLEVENAETYSSPNRYWRFSLDTSAFWLKGLAIGNETKFNCMFYPLIGIYAENAFFYDHISGEETMGNVNLGLNVPIFQFNPLSLYCKLGWTKWYNDVTPLLKDSAFFLGFEFKSYPFKPVAIKWDAGWQFYENDAYVYDSDLQIGIMIDRFEIFSGWKYLETGTEKVDSTHWNGVSGGIRIHF